MPFGSRSVDGRIVSYIDEYEEGDEEVEMLHTTINEVVEDTNPVEDTPIQNSNEAEFKFFLRKSGKDDNEIRRIIRGIKNDIDTIIRGKYDSKHISILLMNSIGALELYLYDFKSSPVMAEINTVKKNIMTEALSLYIDYLKWRESDDTEVLPDTFDLEKEDAAAETAPTRTLAEVEAEINIFRKWNRDVPEGLLEEYQKLLSE